ncbi:MAG: hypothetical protein ACLS8R_08865 [Anaeromassilibacillus sp.]
MKSQLDQELADQRDIENLWRNYEKPARFAGAIPGLFAEGRVPRQRVQAQAGMFQLKLMKYWAVALVHAEAAHPKHWTMSLAAQRKVGPAFQARPRKCWGVSAILPVSFIWITWLS